MGITGLFAGGEKLGGRSGFGLEFDEGTASFQLRAGKEFEIDRPAFAGDPEPVGRNVCLNAVGVPGLCLIQVSAEQAVAHKGSGV